MKTRREPQLLSYTFYKELVDITLDSGPQIRAAYFDTAPSVSTREEDLAQLEQIKRLINF